MKTNPHLADEVYNQVGEEMARNELSPGAMARAVAEANGNKERSQSLYVKFRFEELVRELERDAVAQECQRRQLEADDRQNGIYTCPKCGHRGELKQKERASPLLVFLLMLAYVIPGVLYGLIFDGYKGVCAKCGHTIIPRMK